MKQLMLCQLSRPNCPHCMPAVGGSWGITARPVCRMEVLNGCIHMADADRENVIDLGDMRIVAGYRSRELYRAGPGVLIDILPAILPSEWQILLTFCRDYTQRDIPWMVGKNGRAFKLIKKKKG